MKNCKYYPTIKNVEKGDVMGLFGKLLGGNKAAVPPQLRSIYPPAAAMKIKQEILPYIQSDKIIETYGGYRIFKRH